MSQYFETSLFVRFHAGMLGTVIEPYAQDCNADRGVRKDDRKGSQVQERNSS